jgi:hypothetical protein
MNIKLNNVDHAIKPLSKLTFEEFNKIIGDGKATSLPEYLSLFCDIPIADLFAAKITGFNIPTAQKLIFDLDIEEVIKDKKETVKHKDQVISMEALKFKTFGQSYMFEMIRQKKPNDYEMSVHALAISLSTSLDPEDIKKTYNQLSQQVWTKVLPQGFFLYKRYLPTTLASIGLSLRFTLQLKLIRWKLRGSILRYRNQERTGRFNY